MSQKGTNTLSEFLFTPRPWYLIQTGLLYTSVIHLFVCLCWIIFFHTPTTVSWSLCLGVIQKLKRRIKYINSSVFGRFLQDSMLRTTSSMRNFN